MLLHCDSALSCAAAGAFDLTCKPQFVQQQANEIIMPSTSCWEGEKKVHPSMTIYGTEPEQPVCAGLTFNQLSARSAFAIRAKYACSDPFGIWKALHGLDTGQRLPRGMWLSTLGGHSG